MSFGIRLWMFIISLVFLIGCLKVNKILSEIEVLSAKYMLPKAADSLLFPCGYTFFFFLFLTP